jgi:hypothetical protein
MFFEAVFTGAVLYLAMLIRKQREAKKQNQNDALLSILDLLLLPIDWTQLATEADLQKAHTGNEHSLTPVPEDDARYIDAIDPHDIHEFRYQYAKRLFQDTQKSNFMEPSYNLEGYYQETTGGNANRYAEVRNINV